MKKCNKIIRKYMVLAYLQSQMLKNKNMILKVTWQKKNKVNFVNFQNK